VKRIVEVVSQNAEMEPGIRFTKWCQRCY